MLTIKLSDSLYGKQETQTVYYFQLFDVSVNFTGLNILKVMLFLSQFPFYLIFLLGCFLLKKKGDTRKIKRKNSYFKKCKAKILK